MSARLYFAQFIKQLLYSAYLKLARDFVTYDFRSKTTSLRGSAPFPRWGCAPDPLSGPAGATAVLRTGNSLHSMPAISTPFFPLSLPPFYISNSLNSCYTRRI